MPDREGFAQPEDHNMTTATCSPTTRRLLDNLTGYGPLASLLADPDVARIVVGTPGSIHVRRRQGRSGPHEERFADTAHLERSLRHLIGATGADAHWDPGAPIQDLRLGDGTRVHVVRQAATEAGAGVMAVIDRPDGQAPTSCDELITRGVLSRSAAQLLRDAVAHGASIVFSGRHGSGRTTLLSCCVKEVDPAAVVAIVERRAEIDTGDRDVARLCPTPTRSTTRPVGMAELVDLATTLMPDVVVVGEVVDDEVLEWSRLTASGVTGYTTVAARSARGALEQLRLGCTSGGSRHDRAALVGLISEGTDLIVHSRRTAAGIRVETINAVEEPGNTPGEFRLTTVFRHDARTDRLCWTGQTPKRLAGRLRGAPFGDTEAGTAPDGADSERPRSF